MSLRGPNPDQAAELASFEQPLAAAVVRVLRREGVPADERRGPDAEVTVLVPAERRADAMRVLAARMEDIRDAVEPARGPSSGGEVGEGDEEAARPLLFERLRRLGLLPIALIPLLIITLANVRLPMAYAAAVLVGGMALLLAWRNGRFDKDEDPD